MKRCFLILLKSHLETVRVILLWHRSGEQNCTSSWISYMSGRFMAQTSPTRNHFCLYSLFGKWHLSSSGLGTDLKSITETSAGYLMHQTNWKSNYLPRIIQTASHFIKSSSAVSCHAILVNPGMGKMNVAVLLSMPCRGEWNVFQ